MKESLRELLSIPLVPKFVVALVALSVLFAVLRLVRGTITRYIKENESRYRATKVVTVFGYLLVVITVAVVFSDRLGGLSVALGVAGAGIAFSLQEVIASIAGWFAIAGGNFFSTGDRVQLGGIVGDVIDIGFLRTTLMETGQWVAADQYTGRVVKVANSFVFKEPVYNYSGDFPFLWDEIKVPVKYGSDAREARALFLRIAEEQTGHYLEKAREAFGEMQRKYLIENAAIAPAVFIVCNDNWIEFTIRYVVDYKKRRGTKDALFSRILESVEGSGGKIMMASNTFQLVEAPPLTVRIESGPRA